jgi:hypothetical protein
VETSDASGAKEKPVEQDLAGCRFYRPGVIGTYCVLSLPLGLWLYGLNLARRGSRVMGYSLASICGATLLVMFAASVLDARVSPVGIFPVLLGIVVGIRLFNIEGSLYRLAVSRGGMTARWWPPLLWLLGTMVLVAILATLKEIFE